MAKIFPSAQGHPDHTGSLISPIYKAMFLYELYARTVLNHTTNRDFEGEIKKRGDSVVIPTLPTPIIRDWIQGQKLIRDKPQGGEITMPIDQGKYWNIAVDDLDKVQSRFDFVPEWIQHHAEFLAIEIDKNVLEYMYPEVHVANSGANAGVQSGSVDLGSAGAILQPTSSTITDMVVGAGTVLDEQNVNPTQDRFMIVPWWMHARFKTSDLKVASLTGDPKSPLRTGEINGRVDRFVIHGSSNLKTTTDGGNTVWNVVFGHKKATSFAAQLDTFEKLRELDYAESSVRKIVVFGRKVIKPEAVGHMRVRP